MLGDPSFFPTIAAYTNAPIFAGNKVELLFNGEEIFPAMIQAIAAARHTINYAQYLYEDGQISYELAESFAERCRAGVEVNLLVDSHGAKIPRDVPVLLREAGCNLRWFRGVNLFHLFTPWKLGRLNYRNHRRVLVIDGEIGFTGGHGVSRAWTGDGRQNDHWRETDVRVEGPIVHQLQAAFVDLWLETTGNVLGGDRYFPRLSSKGSVYAQVVKSSPYGNSFESYLLYLLSIMSAQKTIHITTPYFLPDERMQEALLSAVRRGVRVMALTPGTIDHRLAYWASRRVFGTLLSGGVEIYEYQPALLHAKTMVVDGVWAAVGTTNFDNRSFALSEEVNLVVYDAVTAGALEKAFQEDLQYSRRITLEEWQNRPWSERIMEVITRPIERQL